MPATLPRLPTPWGRHAATGRRAAAALIATLLALLLIAVFIALSRGWHVLPAHERALTAPERAAEQECLENALLMHDVQWAASCTALADQGQGDGYAECELPNREAGRLNSQLSQSEQRCVSEARTPER